MGVTTAPAPAGIRPVARVPIAVVTALPAIPLLPLPARTMDALGHSPFVLRIPAMPAGGAKAQTLATTTFAVSIEFSAGGHYLATSTVDPFLRTLAPVAAGPLGPALWAEADHHAHVSRARQAT